MEIHGTIQRRPYEVFLKEEAPCLGPLPPEPFECPLWKECTVHPDHHVVFDKSYYSLPTRFIGKKVWVRGARLVRVFLDGDHIRAERPGTWVTDPTDYPPEKLAYLMATPSFCREKASQIGPHTQTLVRRILSEHAMRNLRKVQAILRLAEKYGSERMEAASQRSLVFDNLRYRSIKTILERGLDGEPKPPCPSRAPLSALGMRFLRAPSYFGSEEVSP